MRKKKFRNKKISKRRSLNRSNDEIKGSMLTVNENRKTIRGDMNTINGNDCTVHGNMNTINGNNCVVYGDMNNDKGHGNKMIGSMNNRLNKNKRKGLIRRRVKRRKRKRNKILTIGEYKEDSDSGSTTVSASDEEEIHSITNGFNFDEPRFGSGLGCNERLVARGGTSITMRNVTMINSMKTAILCRNGKASIMTLNDRTYRFELDRGLMTIKALGFVVKMDPNDFKLKRDSDDAILTNLYFCREIKTARARSDHIYRSISDSKFRLIVKYNEIICENFEKFPELKFEELNEPNKKKRKIGPVKPKRKPEKATVDTADEWLCKICMENKVNTVNLDCDHSCMCSDCGRKIMEFESQSDRVCPICKTYLVKGIKDFIVS